MIGSESNIARLIDEICGHLGAAIQQTMPSDDKIIAEHIEQAYQYARDARVCISGQQHTHRKSSNGDFCGVCALDLRALVHERIKPAALAARSDAGTGTGEG